MIWLFLPGVELSLLAGAAPVDSKVPVLEVRVEGGPGGLYGWAAYHSTEGIFCHERKTGPSPTGEVANERKRLARLLIFFALKEATGKEPGPWGIFTGIRPTKIVHRLLDRGCNREQTVEILCRDYAVRAGKAELITGIALRQRPLLLPLANNPGQVSVYIGIPFCPTRCLYCSFPAYSLNRHRQWVAPFTEVLLAEIRAVGEELCHHNLEVQSIYFGGGTPTSLAAEQLAELLEAANLYLRTAGTVEFTVEGGRPDTLSLERLRICAGAGVTRLSINPQSMQERTLKVIGRDHSVEDVYRAVEAARNVGFPVLNMDVIVGLPGEGVADVESTMEHIKGLAPENVTVHTLAVKRASRLLDELSNHPLPTGEEAAAMWEVTRKYAAGSGMVPYYLYRQKRMLGNLENVGYALPGRECVYNIQMIEERQTVIGLGAGAGSKWVNPRDGSLINQYNPKDPQDYIRRLPELIKRKIDKLAAIR
ncbi:coproporphyrinogen III oxidase [Clostridiales bacterium PH28_bin88]|nr:coproporphyrinogen III oxidase [Clostridiales bacterium PH28_bin88]